MDSYSAEDAKTISDGKTKTVTAPSEIAQNMQVAEESSDPRYDASARNLVAQKPVLAYILKSALEDYEDYTVQEIAENFIEGTPEVKAIAVHQNHPDKGGTPPKTDGMMSGDDKIEGLPDVDKSQKEGTIYYDIRFLALIPQSSELMEIYVNIEIQNNDTPGYAITKRGIYYGARMISAQRGKIFKNQEYGKIKRVVSIWICEDTANARSDSINRYYFTEECKRGDFHEEKENYDLITVVVLRLGVLGEQSQDNAIRLLSKMFSVEHSYEEKLTVLSDEFKISVTKEISEEVLSVCNLSTGVYNKGFSEGEMKKAKEMALSLADMGLSAEKIAEAAKVSVKLVQEWLTGSVSLAK